MSFLLDTDTCSAHLKRPLGLMHRFVQYSGGLHIPTIVLGDLYLGISPHQSDLAHSAHRKRPATRCYSAGLRCGLGQGIRQVAGQFTPKGNLCHSIGAVALVHNLTLITHNTSDFQNIPGLPLDDWLMP
jgi:tRNA(fMet)-specific endonuclease VapC